MKIVKIIIVLVISSMLMSVFSCRYERQKELDTTINIFLRSIADDDYKKFKGMIINESLTLDDDFEFPLLQRLYKKSLYKDWEEDIKYTIVDSLNNMGQLVVKVPYFYGYDSVTAITQIDLYLFFGPELLFPMDKLSKFDIERKWDSSERRKLIGLPPLTPKADSIEKATGKNVIILPDDWE